MSEFGVELFAGMKNVSAPRSTVKIGHGPNGSAKFRLEVDKIELVRSKARPGVVYFVVETTCLETTHPEIEKGDRVSWTQDMSQNENITFGNLKGFGLALNPKASSDDITPERVYALTLENQPAKGLTFDAVAKKAVAVGSGREYSRVYFSNSQKEWVGEKQSVPAADVAYVDDGDTTSATDLPF